MNIRIFVLMLLAQVFFFGCTSDTVDDSNHDIMQAPVITGINYSGGSVTLEWAMIAGASGYQVFTNMSANESQYRFAGSVESNVIVIPGIQDNQEYFFKVCATNQFSTGPFSGPVSLLNDTIPPEISLLSPATNQFFTTEGSMTVYCAVHDNFAISNLVVRSEYGGIVRSNTYSNPNNIDIWLNPLIEGSNSLVLSTRDNHGNTNVAILMIVRDTTPPTITNVVYSSTQRTTNDVSVSVYAAGATNHVQTFIYTAAQWHDFVFFDFMGNNAFLSVIVNWIDRQGPEVPSLYTKNLADRVSLHWSVSGSSDYQRMEIYRSDGVEPASGSIDGMSLIFSGSNETTFDDTTINSGTKYYYVAVAYDDLGNRSIGKISYSFFPYLDMRQWYNNAREDIGLATVDGKIYLMGGYRTGFGGAIWTVQKYDTVSNAVTEVAHMLLQRAWFQGAVVSNTVFVFGGAGGAFYQHLEMYDIASETWQYGPVMPHPAADIVALVHNDQIYLLGGLLAVGSYTNYCMKYSLTNGSFGAYEPLAPKPLNLYPYGGVVYGDKMYVFSPGIAETHVEIYDIISNTWSAGVSLPVVREDFAIARVGNTAYLIGGQVNGAVTGRIDAYNLDDQNFSRKTDLPWARYGMSAVAVGNDIYLIGGRNGSVYSGVIEVYRPLDDQ